MIRGDEAGAYKNIVNVLNVCSLGRSDERRLRDREMKRRPGIAALIVAAAVLLLSARGVRANADTGSPRSAGAGTAGRPRPSRRYARRRQPRRTIMRALPVPDVTDAIPAPTAPPSSASGATRRKRRVAGAKSAQLRQRSFWPEAL